VIPDLPEGGVVLAAVKHTSLARWTCWRTRWGGSRCEAGSARGDLSLRETLALQRLAQLAKPKLLLQLVSRRYERGSILITSNCAVGDWDAVLGDPLWRPRY
jgi:IstB-like ATP binding protein